MENSYKVSICGENFQVKSDQPSQMIERVAEYLDSRIREVGMGNINADKFRLVVLTSMNLAGELFQLRTKLEEYEKRTDQFQEKVRALHAGLDRVLNPAS